MNAARRLAVASLALATAIGLAACGSNDSGKNAAAAAAASQSFLQTPWYSDLTSTQTGCIGTGVIKDFGIDDAVKYGFLAAGDKPVTLKPIVLSSSAAATFTDTFIACTGATTTIRANEVESIAASNGVANTAAAQATLVSCVDTHLTAALVRTALIAGFEGRSNAGILDPVREACSSSYQPAGAAVGQSFLNATSPNYGLTDTQASCLGAGVIKELGAAKAIQYGLLGKGNTPVKVGTITMPVKDATKLADIFVACADPAATIKNDLMARFTTSSSQVKATLEACLNAQLTPALLRRTFIAAFSGDQQNDNLNSVFQACNAS